MYYNAFIYIMRITKYKKLKTFTVVIYCKIQRESSYTITMAERVCL